MKEKKFSVKGSTNFGQHLTLDLSECATETLSDFRLIYKMLNDLPSLIGMNKITQPYCFPYSGLNPKDSGITGIVILAESHCSIHTFEKRDFVFIDVFSCKSFDTEYATLYFKEKFAAKKVISNITERGIGFKRD